MLVSKPSQNVCSSKEQSHTESTSKEYYINQCVMQEDKDKTSKQGVQLMTITINSPNMCVMTRTVNLPSLFLCGQ